MPRFAFDGPDCSVNPDVERVIRDFAEASKPIAALCIAPALMARVLDGAEVTIGNDDGTAQAIAAMGAKHTVTGHGGVVVDSARKLVTAPCYMLESSISQIADGADAAMAALLDLI